MARARSQINIQAQIQGNITGQVAIGQHIIQIGDVHGGFVYVAASGKVPRPRPRAVPVLLRPRPAPGMLDRQQEMATAAAALQAQQPVDLYGAEGEGKTTLLRRLAYDVPEARFPHGIVCLSARRRPVADLLQELFHAFYECDIPIKRTVTQLRDALGSKRALILLDDVELAREEVDELLGAVPSCVFLLCSLERRLWGEGCALSIHGLPIDAAVALVQRELGRPLTTAEQPLVRQLAEAVHGNPLRLLQAAALAAEGPCDLAELVARAAGPAPVESLQRAAVDSRSPSQRRLLGVLAILRGAWVLAEHLAPITHVADATAQLDSLHQQRLVEAREGRYRLAGTLTPASVALPDVSAWSERVLAHLVSWAEQHRGDPQKLAAQAECFLAALDLAVEGQHWNDAIRLARAAEGAFALAGWWEGWKRVVEGGLQGARALGERNAQAWALHQLGTRALCLGDAASARPLLTEALHLWESLGDEIGVAITENNLHLLSLPDAPPSENGKPPTTPGVEHVPPTLASKVVGLLLTLAVAIPIGAWTIHHFGLARLRAATLARVSLAEAVIDGGNATRGYIILDRGAPVEGVAVNLSSSSPDVVDLPAQVTVPAGENGAAFLIRTTRAPQTARVIITATCRDSTCRAELVVRGPSLTLVDLALPPSIVGGQQAEGAVTISSPAPPGGVNVSLAASHDSVTLPATVTIEPDATSAKFRIVTRILSQPTPVLITAAYGPSRQNATLQVQATPPRPVLTSLQLDRPTLVGGSLVHGTVTLSAPVPSDSEVALDATLDGGRRLREAAVPEAAARTRGARAVPSPRPDIPRSVTVKAGSDTGRFQIVTGPTQEVMSLVISATYERVTRTATLIIQPPEVSLARIDLSPNPAVGGNPVTGTVVLSGPAPAAGKVINLRSGDQRHALVPSQVKVEGGQTRAAFPVRTLPVPAPTPIIIEASDGAQPCSRELTLAPPIRLLSFVLNPTRAGRGESVQGTVRLSAPAPAGGVRITLTSSDRTLAPVPSALEIPAGQTSATFTIKTNPVRSENAPPVVITVSYGSQSLQAAIDVAIVM